MRVLIVTAGELTRDPRARRAVEAARGAELEALGVSGAITGDTPRELDGISIVRVDGDTLSGALRSLGLGGMKRSRPPVRALRGMYRPGRLLALNVRPA